MRVGLAASIVGRSSIRHRPPSANISESSLWACRGILPSVQRLFGVAQFRGSSAIIRKRTEAHGRRALVQVHGHDVAKCGLFLPRKLFLRASGFSKRMSSPSHDSNSFLMSN